MNKPRKTLDGRTRERIAKEIYAFSPRVQETGNAVYMPRNWDDLKDSSATAYRECADRVAEHVLDWVDESTPSEPVSPDEAVAFLAGELSTLMSIINTNLYYVGEVPNHGSRNAVASATRRLMMSLTSAPPERAARAIERVLQLRQETEAKEAVS